MSNPVLVEVMRGARVESAHRGAACVADADGKSVLTIGDVERAIFPRSAVKPMQAVPLIESGAAERYGFGDEELAIACASHNGEPGHVAVVERMLARAGLDATALACGAHWPISAPAGQALARSGGTASAVHNNCSGKHAGFLCAACAMGVDHHGYVEPDHPVQREVRSVIEEFTGATLSADRRAVDGCSVPTWAMPFSSLARGFARFGTGTGVSAQRAAAAARLRAACAAQPWMVAGSGRLCTDVMELCGARVLIKTGAEGVYAAALPGEGLGIAVKCDDGAGRAAQVIIANLIARLLPLDDNERVAFARFTRPELRNWNGIKVGELRPTEALT